MSGDWMVLLQQQELLGKVMDTNRVTEQFGLVLTEEDVGLILDERKNSLLEQRRIEFGEGIITKIIYEFCDSDFISASNEPSAVLARAFGDCREGVIPRSLLRFQVMMPRSLLRGISLIRAVMSVRSFGCRKYFICTKMKCRMR